MTIVTEAAVVFNIPRQLYIAGRWQDSETGTTFPVVDLATGREIARIADATGCAAGGRR